MFLSDPDHTDVRSEQRRFAFVAVAFAILATLAFLDLAADLREGTTLQHALTEGIIVVIGAIGITLGVSRIFVLRQHARKLTREAGELAERLQDSHAAAEQWRQEARELLQGLGALIDRQFGRWGLTPAEREVALLILKGFSHKEAAVLRSVAEATVRQQATAIYKKAGVSGRHDLSAFFLEDLLAPPSTGTEALLPSGRIGR
jgi:DNA-binding CsgD family transcriptional regulator